MLSRTLLRSWAVSAVAVAVVCMFAGIASASTAWSDPPVGPGTDGSNARFIWEEGQNDIDPVAGPGFGNPTDELWGFDFSETVDFIAMGGGGSGATTEDETWVTIDCDVHDSFAFITVQEWGTYLGDPGDFTVQASLIANGFIPGGSPMEYHQVDLPDPTWYPYDPEHPELGGDWSAEQTLVLDWERLLVRVPNVIQVSAGAVGGSFIEKDGMRIIIPEPSSALLILAGIGFMAHRRLRRCGGGQAINS